MSEPVRKFGKQEESPAYGHGSLPSDGTDRPRTGVKRRQWGRWVAVLVVVAALGAATYGFKALEKQPATVERSTLWIGTVKSGEFVKDIKASGTLLPKEVRWVPAPGEGRVEKRLVKPGEAVEAGTVLLELSNPTLEKEKLDAEWALTAAEAELKNSEAELKSQILTQESALANMRSEHEVAKLASDRDTKLNAAGILADYEVKVSAAREKELSTRAGLAAKSLEAARAGMEARMSTQQARVEQARALLDLRKREWAALRVTAGAAGVVQQVLVEEGQQVMPGVTLAKVAQAGGLRAELRVQENQASEVLAGQVVQVDTRMGIVPGKVSRIDPAAQGGMVLVEVQFEGELPKGARPDLTVEGTIELARIPDTLYVERPVSVNANATVPIFRIGADGMAVKGPVHFGVASSMQVEVLQGLAAGDEIVLSDTKQWDLLEKLRLR